MPLELMRSLFPKPFPRACWLLLLLSAAQARAQNVGEGRGFKFAEYYDPPHATQMKTLVEGDKAQPLNGGKTLSVTKAKVQTFRETGERDLTLEAPECVYERDEKSIHSPGHISVLAAEGKFAIAGDGFLWQQTNSLLLISNHVQTIVHPDLLGPGTSSSSAPPSATDTNAIKISSDQFHYAENSGEGLYQGHVVVTGGGLNLSCTTFRISLPLRGPQLSRGLQSLIADGNVVADYSGAQVTGGHMSYLAATGIAQVTDGPVWREGDLEGRADEFLVDRTNRIFKANGHGWLRMPGQRAGASVFMAHPGTAAGAPATATNSFVEIESDHYEIRTNSAVFGEPARLREWQGTVARGEMNCGILRFTFSGTNDLDTMVADKNVTIQEGETRFLSDHALFTSTNGLLALTGHPSWRSGLREGKGELIFMNIQANEMIVRSNASLRLPAGELSQAAALKPGAIAVRNARPGDSQFADIFSEEYRVRGDAAWFSGGVYVSHPRMNWSCETLSVDFPANGLENRRLVAEQGVVCDLMDEQGQTVHGRGDRAVYTYGVKSGVTNELLELIGAPAVVQATNGTFQNRIIIFDRANGRLAAPGSYRIRATTPAGTNDFKLPHKRFVK
jgi:lipopolysaccharide export system protein LptA